jgi:hypothetical protein
MVDLMQTQNGRSCYSNELFAETEVTLQRRMGHPKEILEKKKHQESDEIICQVEKKHKKELEKEKGVMEYMKQLQNQFPDVSNISFTFSKILRIHFTFIFNFLFFDLFSNFYILFF